MKDKNGKSIRTPMTIRFNNQKHKKKLRKQLISMIEEVKIVRNRNFLVKRVLLAASIISVLVVATFIFKTQRSTPHFNAIVMLETDVGNIYLNDETLKEDEHLESGDVLLTLNNGECSIGLSDKVYMDVFNNTQIVFSKLYQTTYLSEIEMEIVYGSVYIETTKGRNDSFIIRTFAGMIETIGTVFNLEVRDSILILDLIDGIILFHPVNIQLDEPILIYSGSILKIEDDFIQIKTSSEMDDFEEPSIDESDGSEDLFQQEFEQDDEDNSTSAVQNDSVSEKEIEFIQNENTNNNLNNNMSIVKEDEIESDDTDNIEIDRAEEDSIILIPYNHIRMDGSFQDWEEISPVIEDELGDVESSKSGSDIKSLILCRNTENFFFKLDFNSSYLNISCEYRIVIQNSEDSMEVAILHPVDKWILRVSRIDEDVNEVIYTQNVYVDENAIEGEIPLEVMFQELSEEVEYNIFVESSFNQMLNITNVIDITISKQIIF